MRRLLLLPLLLPLAVLGQTPTRLSLAETEVLWRAHSHELKLAGAALAGAQADLRTAGQVPNPQLSLNVLSLNPSSKYGSWQGRADSQLRLDQLIERGGKRELRQQTAAARLEAARQDLDEAGRLERLRLQFAYYDLLLAQEKQRVALEAAALYDASVEAGKLRLRAGDIALVDLARLQIDQSRAANDARQAQAELEIARAALAYLIGREQDAHTLVASDDWPALDEATRVPSALDNRPDVVAARQRVAAAEAARDLARAQKTRDITVGMQVERNRQDLPANTVGFGVSVPLFLWHANEGEIARAEAELDAARQQYAMVLAQAVGSVDQARSALASARARRQRLDAGLLADAEKVAKAAEFAYTQGAMGLMDLLDARRTLRQVQVEAANARADHAKALAAWTQANDGKTP